MSSESNEFPAVPRRRPTLQPDAPPPAEEAPPPRPVFRLRQDAPTPSEPPSRDKQRELFFINWKAHHPHGEMGSEEFERAYGDHQLRQGDAKRFYRDRERQPPWRKVVIKAVILVIALIAGLQAVRWLRGVIAGGKNPAPSSQAAPNGPARP